MMINREYYFPLSFAICSNLSCRNLGEKDFQLQIMGIYIYYFHHLNLHDTFFLMCFKSYLIIALNENDLSSEKMVGWCTNATMKGRTIMVYAILFCSCVRDCFNGSNFVISWSYQSNFVSYSTTFLERQYFMLDFQCKCSTVSARKRQDYNCVK